MNTIPATAAIILAAGTASRMGQGRHKLLLPLAGRPVVAHVLDAALSSQARPIIVVLGHQAEQVRAHIASYSTHPEITFVENPDYAQGMSTSLKHGLQALQEQSQLDSVLILLGDQPLMTAEIIDTLITTRHTSGKAIVAPLYAGKRGNPTLFAASLLLELAEVTGDEGGRRVVEQHRQELALVEMPDVMANIDVDTWEAYQQVLTDWQKKHDQQ